MSEGSGQHSEASISKEWKWSTLRSEVTFIIPNP